jgi:thiol:disulfide interchange protein
LALGLVAAGLVPLGLGALDAGAVEPRWVLEAPATVRPGVPFEVTARVTLPPGYYQDAASAFLDFEPVPSAGFRAAVTGRSASSPAVRGGKPSYTGTFTLHRTVILAPGTPGGRLELGWTLGWQICQADGVCLLPAQRTASVTLAVEAPEAGSPDAGSLVWAFLAAAFVGGLLLNVMPCVFPVLVLKLVSLKRRGALATAAGSWVTLTALGVVTAGAAALGQRLDWGFSFQSPWFVGALALGFWVWALQLAGVVVLPWSPFRGAGRVSAATPGSDMGRSPWARSFLGGVVIVLAAAPCTAPLLGPALGFAFAQPPVWIPVFFAAAGLGLALPLVVVALVPGLVRLVPRPGPWMVVAERIAGVVLGATVVYLVWIWSRLTVEGWFVPALGVLGLAAAAWAVPRGWKGVGRVVQGALVVGALVVIGVTAVAPGPLAPGTSGPDRGGAEARLPGWVAFSTQALAEARAQGKAVFVDATADWCATCQVNEAAVLLRPDVAELFERRGIVRMRADDTRPNLDIEGWLAAVGRAGLPVYALYGPGRDSGSPPELFPELLTDDNFTRVIERVPLTPEKPNLPESFSP